VIIGLAVLALVAVLAFIPSAPSRRGASGQARYAFAPRVLAVLALSFLVFAALFAALTYVVPFLQSVTGVSGALISVFLLAYGVATAVGALAGGRFADQDAALALNVGTVGVAASLLALSLFGTSAVVVALALFSLGLFGFGTGPSLQYRVVELAGPGGALASSLPASAINLGIAFGSSVGGLAVASYDASAAMMAGLVIAAVAIGAAWATRLLEPPTVDDADHTALAPARQEAA
jgi:DHA1 family inner membrane transport protein